MIRAMSTSDSEFREGYQNAVRSPIYEDQLLQHESTVDVDGINAFNELQGRKSKKEQENEKQDSPAQNTQMPCEEVQKPR